MNEQLANIRETMDACMQDTDQEEAHMQADDILVALIEWLLTANIDSHVQETVTQILEDYANVPKWFA